jgi:RNA polymerase sigma-70 factor, ECF subfamily
MPDFTVDHNEQFVTRMTAAQPALFAFILSLAPNVNDARDVLSETNLALWKKREEFDPTMDYWPWACRFAWGSWTKAEFKSFAVAIPMDCRSLRLPLS